METQTRLDVLHGSLVIEDLISSILGNLLDIDYESSKTLGSKTSSLTFKNKIDLITDMRVLKKEDAKKFELFATIRNKFIHNLRIDTFLKCFENLNGEDKVLVKLYPLMDSESLSDEAILKKCFDSLFIDLNKIIGTVFSEIYKNEFEKGRKEGEREISNFIIESIKDVRQELSDANEARVIEEIFRRTEKKYLDLNK